MALNPLSDSNMAASERLSMKRDSVSTAGHVVLRHIARF